MLLPSYCMGKVVLLTRAGRAVHEASVLHGSGVV